jgi:hypothetical protein
MYFFSILHFWFKSKYVSILFVKFLVEQFFIWMFMKLLFFFSFFVHLHFQMFRIIYDWNIICITSTINKKITANFLFYVLIIKIIVFFLLFFFFILIFILNCTYGVALIMWWCLLLITLFLAWVVMGRLLKIPIFCLQEVQSMEVEHVKRKANQAAHLLAKYGLCVLNDCTWLGECPSPI